jgi:outer membrane protein OmpA-like peptidoglycan-associated protein
MEFPIKKWIGIFNINVFTLPALLIPSLLCCALTGCASSAVSRNAADQVDSAYQSGNSAVKSIADDDLPSYPNYSSVALGAGAGSAVGAVAGALISGGTGVLPGAAGGAVVGGVMGGYLNNHANLKDQIENHGIKVFILGDQVRIVIPSEQTFRGITPSVYPEAYPTLNMVAQLLNRFKTMQVKIAVYSDDAGSDKINAGLSKQQADALVKYYWGKINTRVIYGVGMGDCHLVDEEGAAANSRIEISTEKLPV